MREVRALHPWFLVVCLIVALVPAARADVAPGDVIDKTNWEKAQDLLPEPVLDWVKKGDFILNIHGLKYRPLDFFPPYQLSFHRRALTHILSDPGQVERQQQCEQQTCDKNDPRALGERLGATEEIRASADDRQLAIGQLDMFRYPGLLFVFPPGLEIGRADDDR